MQRIFVDMDGVLAEWQDAPIEEVTAPGYFLYVKPVANVIQAIRLLQLKFQLIEECEIFILSSVFNDDHSIAEKNEWLNKNGFSADILPDHRIFVPYGYNKSIWLEQSVGIRKNDVLIDDFTFNLINWHGVGIKMLNGINGTKGNWNGYVVRNNMTATKLANQLYGIISVE